MMNSHFSESKARLYHRDTYAAPDAGDDLIPGILPGPGLLLLAGAPKSGKTDLALAMAWSVATGTTFAGREVRRGCAVYANYDLSARDMNRLLAPFPKDQDGDLYIADGLAPLDSDFGRKSLESLWNAAPVPPNLLVIDSLPGALHRTNAQNPLAVRNFMGRLMDLCDDHDVTILLIGPTDAWDRRAAGPFPMCPGVSRTMRLSAAPHPADPGSRALELALSGRGVRLNERLHLASPAPGAYVADEPHDDHRSDALGATSGSVRRDPVGDRIKGALASGSLTLSDLLERTDLRLSAARRTLSRLLDAGEIHTVGRTAAGYIYAIGKASGLDTEEVPSPA